MTFRKYRFSHFLAPNHDKSLLISTIEEDYKKDPTINLANCRPSVTPKVVNVNQYKVSTTQVIFRTQKPHKSGFLMRKKVHNSNRQKSQSCSQVFEPAKTQMNFGEYVNKFQSNRKRRQSQTQRRVINFFRTTKQPFFVCQRPKTISQTSPTSPNKMFRKKSKDLNELFGGKPEIKRLVSRRQSVDEGKEVCLYKVREGPPERRRSTTINLVLNPQMQRYQFTDSVIEGV